MFLGNFASQIKYCFVYSKDVKFSSFKCSVFNKRVNSEKEFFSQNFWGDTNIKTVGSYWDGKNLIKEKGAIVESSMSAKKYEDNKKVIADRLKGNRKLWDQDTVLVKVEGESFIYPKKGHIVHDKKREKEKILVS